MSGLTPNPIDQTNNLLLLLLLRSDNSTLTALDLNPPFTPSSGLVRQNCIFFASLFTSLLAAAGAVLAKQWLANYERTGQTGPLDQQGLWRTEKYLGAESWGLRQVVETLPTLILISLGLFFVAMADYVWTINRDVAIVVTEFSVMGTLLYILMLVAAAVFPSCPFQTSPSTMLAGLGRTVLRPVYLLVRNAILLVGLGIVNSTAVLVGFPYEKKLRGAAEQLNDYWTPIRHLSPSSYRPNRKDKPHTHTGPHLELLYAESARSMLVISPHEDIILTVARNIPTLSDLKSIQQLAQSSAVLILASQLGTTMVSLQASAASLDSDNKEEEQALVLARALVHILSVNPTKWGSDILAYLLTFPKEEAHNLPRWLRSPELKVIFVSIIQFCTAQPSVLKTASEDLSISWDEVLPHIPFEKLLEQGIKRDSPITQTAALGWLHQFILSEGHQQVGGGDDETSLTTSLESFNLLIQNGFVQETPGLFALAAKALFVLLGGLDDGVNPVRPKWKHTLEETWAIRSGYAFRVFIFDFTG